MAKFVLVSLFLMGLSAGAQQLPNVYSAEIDFSKGEKVDYSKDVSSPYRGGAYVRMGFLPPKSVPVVEVRSGMAEYGGDYDLNIPGEKSCWTEMIYQLGEMQVDVFELGSGKQLGSKKANVRASVISERPYDELCSPVVVSNSEKVVFESKDFYNANIRFELPDGMSLVTHFLTIEGSAKIVDGNLTDINLTSGEDSSVQWFASGKRGVTVSGHSLLRRMKQVN